jgi:uncharacterized membrane protein
MNTRIKIAAVVGYVAALPVLALGSQYVESAPSQQAASQTWSATLSKLPSLGGNAEALGVNEAGTVIVGHSFDRSDLLYAVKWTLQSGSWVISKLPYPGSAIARGIDNQGNVVGYAASSPRHPILWPAAGGYTVLGCDSDAAVAYAISADGQTVVGQGNGRATAWHAPQSCTEYLPPLEEGGPSSAFAVNGDGSIIGGGAAHIAQAAGTPVRWIGIAGQRVIEQLDTRPGTVYGANNGGDLAGLVTIPCAVVDGCQRAVIWFAAGGSRQLGTLGGEHSWARDINAAGEVVGVSTSRRAGNTAYFWSQSTGMIKLPVKRWAAANAVSDVRLDGTRLVVGMNSQAVPVVWVVRTP